MTPDARVGEHDARWSRPRNEAAMVAVLLVATFMAQFDFFVVNVAAPTLRHDLTIGDVALELVVGGYAFAYAAGAGAPVAGSATSFGHRRHVRPRACCGFAATSAALRDRGDAGPADRRAARPGADRRDDAAAGAGPDHRGPAGPATPSRATAWYGVALGRRRRSPGRCSAGSWSPADVAGLGWRTIFLVNVPVGIAGALLATRLPPASRGPVVRRARSTRSARLALAVSLALLLVPLTLGRTVQAGRRGPGS